MVVISMKSKYKNVLDDQEMEVQRVTESQHWLTKRKKKSELFLNYYLTVSVEIEVVIKQYKE